MRSRKATKLQQTAQVNNTSEAKKPQKLKIRVFKIQFGHPVPKKWTDLIYLDTQNGNCKWKDAVAKEVAALLELGCFDIKSPNFKPSNDYQYVPMHWVYAVKSDLTYKARLVCDGSCVDPKGLDT